MLPNLQRLALQIEAVSRDACHNIPYLLRTRTIRTSSLLKVEHGKCMFKRASPTEAWNETLE